MIDELINGQRAPNLFESTTSRRSGVIELLTGFHNFDHAFNYFDPWLPQPRSMPVTASPTTEGDLV